MGWWTNDRQLEAFNYLASAGLSPYGAAGLVSRWANVESTGQGPFSVNPSSGAFGIAQWLGARLPPIRGNTDFYAQLAYVVQELNGSEARAGQVLRTASTARDGAIGATMYERAEGYNGTTDNFTGRTQNGIASILQLAGAGNGDEGAIDESGQWQPSDNQQDFLGSAGISAPVLIGAGLFTIFLLRRLEII